MIFDLGPRRCSGSSSAKTDSRRSVLYHFPQSRLPCDLASAVVSIHFIRGTRSSFMKHDTFLACSSPDSRDAMFAVGFSIPTGHAESASTLQLPRRFCKRCLRICPVKSHTNSVAVNTPIRNTGLLSLFSQEGESAFREWLR
jgi:hypothetical protein